MTAVVLAMMVMVLSGLALPAWSEEANPDAARPIRDALALFDKNHCGDIKNPAEQLFCGDPDLNALLPKLNSAIQDRLDRLADRKLAIEENAQWVLDRNSSCGIFGRQPVTIGDFNTIKACLLKETEERIAMLADPNFDCLATNTAAGSLICSDASLALADMELNSHVVSLISKMNEDDAKSAFAEYARWIRNRDRKCGLADKNNVPLRELSPSESCLAEYINQMTAEILAAKGDPRRIFGKPTASSAPDADAVDSCVAQIHAANTCEGFLRVANVVQIDSEMTEREASVIAEVEMIVLSPFAVCSPIASGCTGACWDLKSGVAKSSLGSRESLSVAHRLKIEKTFAFKKTDNGGWRCDTGALSPIDLGVALGGP